MAPESPCFHFPLLWTVGFSGKRQLPGLEDRVRQAVDQAVQFLCEKAAGQNARLTAVSSIARGADVIFAECCMRPRMMAGHASVTLPWKCLLPFHGETFFEHDLKDDPDQASRRESAEDCLRQKSGFDVLVRDKSQMSDAERVTAYLECGYRTVDESDVMILVLREHEFHDVIGQHAARLAGHKSGLKPAPGEVHSQPVLSLKAGTRAIALYATAAKRPSILLNADAVDPWASKVVLNDPNGHGGEWFQDPNVTEVMREALSEAWAAPQEESDCCEKPMQPTSSSLTMEEETMVPCSAMRRDVWTLMKRLGRYADHCQKTTHRGLVAILTLHLVATGFAALGTTVLKMPAEEKTGCLLVILLLGLAFLKPVLAAAALGIEHLLHASHKREKWLYARILAELCRGAWAMWPLPTQPMDAADEEDFPKVKRLLRTLRLMRDVDACKAAVSTAAARVDPAASLYENETQDEANMRVACGHYIDHRLQDQADYYGRKLGQSRLTLTRWQRLFHGALIGTIFLGLVLAMHKLDVLVMHPGHPHEAPDLFCIVEFGVIIGPFLASYALGMITILDCRRRARRYDEMQWFLNRLAGTLRDCSANPSRLRLIEHAERMMIEEQHEWFSTTRNFSV